MKSIKAFLLGILFIALSFSFFSVRHAFADPFTLSGTVKNSSGDAIVGATVTVNDANNDSTTTDNDGSYSLSVPSGTYNIQVTPPSGSEFSPAVAPNQTISEDKVLDFILTPIATGVTLSGHVYDGSNTPLANQLVQLTDSQGHQFSTTTNNSGMYSIGVESGKTWSLYIHPSVTGYGYSSDWPFSAPASYNLYSENLSLDQSTVIDFTLPVKQVNIHVQDPQGAAVAGAVVYLQSGGTSDVNATDLSIGGGITNAHGSSYYDNGNGYPSVSTDSNGNVTLWLFPTPSGKSYTVNVIPGGNLYLPFTLNNVVVTGTTNKVVFLQYSHATPTTTATLSPNPDGNGKYSDPTTVTLSATAAAGYTIDHTYYTIDGGSQQTYSTSFTVTGNGSHTVTYWSIDNSGVREATKNTTFTINSPSTITLNAIADTYIKQGSQNENEGSSTFVRLQASGHNRGIVKFDESQIESAIGNSSSYTAKLRMKITDNGNNWGTSGRAIEAHRMSLNWAEGNGFISGNQPSNRGTGAGATWNCAVDSNIANQNDDCSGSTAWNMDNSASWPFSAGATDTKTIQNNQSGIVEFDVTADVQAFKNGSSQNYGWLIKKTDEGQNGNVQFGTKETSNTPVLVITKN